MNRLARTLAPLFVLVAVAAGAQEGQPQQNEQPNQQQRPTGQMQPRQGAVVRAPDQPPQQDSDREKQPIQEKPEGRRRGRGAAQAQPQGQPEGQQAQGQPQGQPQGQQPPPAERRPAGAAASSDPAMGELSAAINRESGMLRIHAAGNGERQDATVIVGEEFTTHITYSRNTVVPFDQVRVILSYEPDKIEPISINDGAVATFLNGEPIAEVDHNFGMLLYEATLAQPASVVNAPMLTIRWKTLRVSPSTRIEFSRRDEFVTALNLEGQDLLGNPRYAGDGTLDMAAVILPDDPRQAEALLSDPRLYTTSDEKIGGVRLLLQPQEEPIVVGEPFAVDIILDNRASSMLDAVNLLIEFDPAVIQILDADFDNWITREINIHDGPFRKEFPWDFHIDNKIWNLRGNISYRVGTSDAAMTRGRMGTIARIHGIAKRPTQATALYFKFAENPRANATSVRYIGQDVLGDIKVFNDGTTGVLLPVMAAPPGQVTNLP